MLQRLASLVIVIALAVVLVELAAADEAPGLGITVKGACANGELVALEVTASRPGTWTLDVHRACSRGNSSQPTKEPSMKRTI